MDFVLVYKYRCWNEDSQQFETSRGFFTLEAIKAGLGSPLVETGMKVRADEILNGRYTGGHVASHLD